MQRIYSVVNVEMVGELHQSGQKNFDQSKCCSGTPISHYSVPKYNECLYSILLKQRFSHFASEWYIAHPPNPNLHRGTAQETGTPLKPSSLGTRAGSEFG